VNLVLLQPTECGHPLPHDDRRVQHVIHVLRRDVGDEFDAGLINGPRGKARLAALDAAGATFTFTATHPAIPADDVTLLLGLCRPQTARDILRDATTLGVTALHFVATEKSEPSYAASSLWRDDEWQRHALAGAEQAFSTQVPAVTAGQTLGALLAPLPPDTVRLALDNYESTMPLAGHALPADRPLALALGPERGWGPRDRAELRAAGFTLVHLGARVLRLETAVVAALTLAKAARGTL
jgi:RsmE family RNA methyltransferase